MFDLIAQRFGKVVVIRRAENKGVHPRWNCICDCGNEFITSGQNLRVGRTTSCGCIRREMCGIMASSTNKTHGMTKTRTFKSWDSMKQRCLNPKSPDFQKYGGRGITICERWVHSFENFFYDMGERPEGNSLDRENVNGNYEPSNCRWATLSKQQRNKTNTLHLNFNGETKSLPEWADITGISRKIIADRLRVGWSVEDALTKPNRKSK